MPRGQAQIRPVEDAELEPAPLAPAEAADARDAVAAVGLLLVVVGVALIYPPAAWIVLGAALLFVAFRA